MDCIEKRLGHPLTVADISLCKVTTIHNAYTRSLLENEGIYNGMCLLKKELAYNLRVKVLHTVDSDMNYNVGKIGRIHDRLIWFKNVCCVLNENWIVQVQY